jgi:choline dehydrogenase-like flavoprotein
VTPHFDIIIIGTGAGGGTIAHALAASDARILVLERGDFVPQEDENWSAEAVWKDLRYRTREYWLDEEGREFHPYTHYNVGGNTKFWGSVLYRLRREDFQELQHADGISPAWPIDYETLAPYYDRAERLYQVRGSVGDDPTEPPHGPCFPPCRTRRRWRGSRNASAPGPTSPRRSGVDVQAMAAASAARATRSLPPDETTPTSLPCWRPTR